MANTLNFNKRKNKFFTVVLPDENETTLLITTPKKAVFESFTQLQSGMNAYENETDALDDMYEVIARLMSENKNKIVVTAKQAEEMFDLEDLYAFITAYTAFINEVTSAKN